MATKAEEKENGKKKTVLQRITDYLTGNKDASKKSDDDDADADADAKKSDDEDAKKTDEDSTDASAKETGEDDPDDADDPDKDDDEDDADPYEKNGQTFNLAKPEEARAAVSMLEGIISQQNALLSDAAKELAKTSEEIKNEIKSDFTPEGSKRSNKAKAELPPIFAPQGTIAKAVMANAISKAKSEKNFN